MRRPREIESSDCAPARGPRSGRALAIAGRAGASAPPLVDRIEEVAALRAALESALAGSGGTVLLAGEPGIGKTRLADVIAGEAEARGVPVWWGRGWEEGSAPAFWPWSTALRRWLAQTGPEGRRAATGAAGRWAAELANVFPALGDSLADREASTGGDSERDRFRVFDGVSRFLAAIAAPSGLVVVLDDVHWADGPSLRLLEYVTAEVSSMRVLVIATYRDTEVAGDDPFSATLTRLAREPSTRRLSVGGLAADDCARWVALTGFSGDAAALGARLHRETNGNPFFIGEIVNLLTRDGGLEELEAHHVPQGVREVVERRVARLGDSCRSVLGVAALIGETVDARLLAEVLPGTTTADHIERAVGDRILIALDERHGRYAFAHGLIRRVLADRLRPSERTGWHARIAEVLERYVATADVVTTELVRHFAAADSPEALRKAFDYACRGAERAARALGWEEAVRLHEIALDAGTRCGALDADGALERELALALALRGAGEVEAARARSAAVMKSCRRLQRPAAYARAALIHVGPMPEFGRVAPEDRAVLEEACRGAAALDDGLRARVFARLAGDLIAANETAQADRVLALGDQAACAARRAGDPGALAMALLAIYYAAALRMRPRDPAAVRPPVPSADEILAAAEAGGEHEMAAAIRHLRAMGAFAIGDPDAFSAEVDALVTAAAQSRAPQVLRLADALVALRASVEGRLDEGRDVMERVLVAGRRMRIANAVGQHMAQRIMRHFVVGRLGEIAPEIDAFIAEHPGGTGWQPMRALAHLARGDVARARDELRALLAAGLRPAEGGVMSRCYLAGLAHLCIELGDRESAPALYERALRQKEAWIVDGCHTFGTWAQVRGGLARLCDRPVEAVEHFAQAVDLARRMRARPFLAPALVLLAEAQHGLGAHAGDGDRCAALLDEAERLASELALDSVRARAASLRAALTTRRSAPASTFRCDGDVWTVSFGGREVLLRDGKGPEYLATLLAAPDREVHVLELAGGVHARSAADAPAGLEIGGGPGGAVEDAPDARAARAYRQRVDDLRAELEEAEALCDLGRAERVRAELDSLVAQLAQRFGGRGRTRSPAETARKAVTKVLRTQIGKLLEVHPPLGEHLRASVRMGTFCSYAPATATRWEIACASPARARH